MSDQASRDRATQLRATIEQKKQQLALLQQQRAAASANSTLPRPTVASTGPTSISAPLTPSIQSNSANQPANSDQIASGTASLPSLPTPTGVKRSSAHGLESEHVSSQPPTKTKFDQNVRKFGSTNDDDPIVNLKSQSAKPPDQYPGRYSHSSHYNYSPQNNYYQHYQGYYGYHPPMGHFSQDTAPHSEDAPNAGECNEDDEIDLGGTENLDHDKNHAYNGGFHPYPPHLSHHFFPHSSIPPVPYGSDPHFGVTSFHNSTPSNQSKPKVLCTKWPFCQFHSQCRFAHPLLSLVAATRFSPLDCLGHQGHQMSGDALKMIANQMASFSVRPNQIGLSSLNPPLPFILNPQNITFNGKCEFSADDFVSIINGAENGVGLVAFMNECLKKSSQLSTIKQDALLLACGLPPVATIMNAVDKFLKSEAEKGYSENNQRMQIEVIPIPFTIPKSSGVEIPKDGGQVQNGTPREDLSDDVSDQRELVASMFIFPLSSQQDQTQVQPTGPGSQSISVRRIHIVPSIIVQNLFEQNFQIVTSTAVKSLFLCTNPTNPQFFNQRFVDALVTSAQQRQPLSGGTFNGDMNGNGHGNAPTKQPKDRLVAQEEHYGKKRKTLAENPAFRVYPVNFVHGGSVVQRQTDGDENDLDQDDSLVCVGEESHPSNSNPTNSALPLKYRHLKPYSFPRDPKVFYTYDQIILQRHGAEIALAEKMAQRAIQNNLKTTTSSVSPLDKHRLVQEFMPSTINKPITFFKPYSVQDLTQSATSNASVLYQRGDAYSLDSSWDPTGFGRPGFNSNNALVHAQQQYQYNSLLNPLVQPHEHDQGLNDNYPRPTMLTPQQEAEDQELMRIYDKSRFWLQDAGWSPGQGLGSNPQSSISKPLPGVVRPERYGLGNVENDDDNY